MAELFKDLFCARCQQVTSHKGEVDSNGEFLFTCTVSECGRFIKFPGDTNIEEFNKLVEVHQETNVGQVDLEKQNEKLAVLLGLSTESAPTVTTEAESVPVETAPEVTIQPEETVVEQP